MVRMLGRTTIVAAVSTAVYFTAIGVLWFMNQYWPIVLSVLVVMAFAVPEIGRWRYTLQRDHRGFLYQVKGPRNYEPTVNDSPYLY